MSNLDGAMESADVESADVSWRDALDCIAVDGRHISAQEVSDFCSVLSLAERVHIVGAGRTEPAMSMLAAQLTGLGYPVYGAEWLTAVEASDTVVIINGPPSPNQRSLLDPLLRPAIEAGAVLLAIATDGWSPVLTLADAGIAIPLPRPRGRANDRLLACAAFDLLVSLIVDVVGQDLAGRITSHRYATRPWLTSRAQSSAAAAAVLAASTDREFSDPGPDRVLMRCSAGGQQ